MLTLAIIAIAALLVLVAGVVAFTIRTIRRVESRIVLIDDEWMTPEGAGPLRPFDPARDRDELEQALTSAKPQRRSSLLLALAVAVLVLATPAAASTSASSSSGRLKCDKPMPRLGFDGHGNRNPNSPAGVRWIGRHCKVTP